MTSAQQHKLFVSLLALGVLGLAACSKVDQATEGAATSVKQSRMHAENEILLGGASPFEDLTESAVLADKPGMDLALGTIEKQLGIIRPVLDPAGRERFDSLMGNIKAARAAGTYMDVALNAVEGYRVLVEGLHEEALLVPKAVSLLDYVGFRLSVLADSQTPDWAAIDRTVKEARGFWESIAQRVERKGLKDAMNTTIDGIEHSAEIRDVQMALFAARVDLDLVDLLESYFEEIGNVVAHGNQ
jgi:hypothetical protein